MKFFIQCDRCKKWQIYKPHYYIDAKKRAKICTYCKKTIVFDRESIITPTRKLEKIMLAGYISLIQFQILQLLEIHGSLTRYEIIDELNKPNSTVHENLIKLESAGYIVSTQINNEKKGRPAYSFKLNEEVST